MQASLLKTRIIGSKWKRISTLSAVAASGWFSGSKGWFSQNSDNTDMLLSARKKSDNETILEVDENNHIIGPVTRSRMRKNNLWHRASFIFVFNENDEIFVQKRVMTKDYCPGYYDVSAGGVVGYDIIENVNNTQRINLETISENAYRELEEELGIKTDNLIFYGMFPYSDEKTNVWGTLWYYKVPNGTNIKIQETEIDCVELKTIEKIENECKNGVKYTKDGLHALKILQQRMKSNEKWNPSDYDS